MNYSEFLNKKTHLSGEFGFDPTFMPDMLFDFQKAFVEWNCKKGRSADFADCGLGKTFIQLSWAENVSRHTHDGRVLVLAPLAVSSQTQREGEKIGVDVIQRKEGIEHHDRIVVTNYERLHYFNPSDFVGVVCDESSILKHYTGATQKNVTRFLTKIKYRLLCTATAAPNDYVELGTSSEALGELSHSDMLSRFFRQLDDKGQKKALREQHEAEIKSQHFAKLSFRVAQSIGQWRLKNYAVNDFWKWVASWAKACRYPSDLGFDDTGFKLPALTENEHIIQPQQPLDGWLFTMPAIGLNEEREERKRTIIERCEYAAELANHNDPVVIWCHYNAEGETLNKMIPNSVEVSGKTSDDRKEEIYNDFVNGKIRCLITKPKIGAWGLNWQHCAHTITFATHSYEQYYQSVRRFWRFGQKSPVRVDIIVSEGEKRVMENMRRKAVQSDLMFEKLIRFMNEAQQPTKKQSSYKKMEVPSWL